MYESVPVRSIDPLGIASPADVATDGEVIAVAVSVNMITEPLFDPSEPNSAKLLNVKVVEVSIVPTVRVSRL